MKILGRHLILSTLLAGAISACGDIKKPSSPGRSENSSNSEQDLSEQVEPSADYYELVMSNELDAVFGSGGAASEESTDVTVFVNLDGANVSKGVGAGKAYVICVDQATVPSTKLSAEELKDLQFYISNYFTKMDEAIKIVFKKPASGSYSIVHVGGKPQDIGCNKSSLKFRAPIDHGNMNSADVAFVFSAGTNLDDLVTHVETAIETILNVGGSNSDLAGKSEPITEEDLPGREELHALSRLLWELEEDKVVDLQALQSELDTLIPGGARYIDDLDKIVSVALGVSDHNTGTTSGGTSGGLAGWIGGLLGTGGTTGGTSAAGILSAVAVLAGHPEIAAASQLLSPLLKNNPAGTSTADGSKENQGSGLPDFASFISLGKPADLAQLFTLMRGHAQFVTKNYDEDTQKALNSLLVVAYSQSFRTLFE